MQHETGVPRDVEMRNLTELLEGQGPPLRWILCATLPDAKVVWRYPRDLDAGRIAERGAALLEEGREETLLVSPAEVQIYVPIGARAFVAVASSDPSRASLLRSVLRHGVTHTLLAPR